MTERTDSLIGMLYAKPWNRFVGADDSDRSVETGLATGLGPRCCAPNGRIRIRNTWVRTSLFANPTSGEYSPAASRGCIAVPLESCCSTTGGDRSSLGLPQPNDAAISRVSPSSFGEKLLERFEGRAAADNGHQDGDNRHGGAEGQDARSALPEVLGVASGAALVLGMGRSAGRLVVHREKRRLSAVLVNSRQR